MSYDINVEIMFHLIILNKNMCLLIIQSIYLLIWKVIIYNKQDLDVKFSTFRIIIIYSLYFFLAHK